MKVLLNLKRVSDSVSEQMQFISLRATSETDRAEYSGVVEIVVNEYCGAAYINLFSLYSSSLGFQFSSLEEWHRRPRFMINENEELDVGMVPYSYDKFDEPPDDEPDYDENEDNYEEWEDR